MCGFEHYWSISLRGTIAATQVDSLNVFSIASALLAGKRNDTLCIPLTQDLLLMLSFFFDLKILREKINYASGNVKKRK